MNDWPARNAYPGKSFNQTCDFCGAVFHVETQLQDGHNESEEYYCPECMKEYRIRACITPTVRLVSSRTDNRNDNCPRD